jgi:lipopolysaccharide export system permease protein
MLGSTLGLYLGRRFLVTILAVFLVCAALIYVIDLIELLRRASDSGRASMEALLALAGMRLPGITIRVLPFAVLFGSMITFAVLSRRLELVVARAAGMSVWQFIAPAILVALLLGLFTSLTYDSLAARLQGQADDVEAALLRSRSAGGKQGWVRQRSIDGQAIVHAKSSGEGGRHLKGVTVFTFTDEGAFDERIEAEEARLGDGFWELRNARVVAVGREPRTDEVYLLATNLTAQQIEEGLEPPTVDFWQLGPAIDSAERAGLPTTGLYLRRQMLLAQPVLFAAMVLIAATVSLRLARLGSIAPAIIGGVVAGFMLYVATKLAEDLGAAGLVSPVAAAWLPALLGVLMSVTVLLHQEDG